MTTNTTGQQANLKFRVFPFRDKRGMGNIIWADWCWELYKHCWGNGDDYHGQFDTYPEAVIEALKQVEKEEVKIYGEGDSNGIGSTQKSHWRRGMSRFVMSSTWKAEGSIRDDLITIRRSVDGKIADDSEIMSEIERLEAELAKRDKALKDAVQILRNPKF